MSKLFRAFACVLLSSWVTAHAVADNGGYVRLSELVVSSFECATLAAHARRNEEENRLVAYGLAKGRAFVDAYRAGLVTEKEMNQVDLLLPMVLRYWSFQKLDVPVDFTVGNIYETIWSRTTAEIGVKTRKLREHQRDYSVWATVDFKEKNCAFVGL